MSTREHFFTSKPPISANDGGKVVFRPSGHKDAHSMLHSPGFRTFGRKLHKRKKSENSFLKKLQNPLDKSFTLVYNNTHQRGWALDGALSRWLRFCMKRGGHRCGCILLPKEHSSPASGWSILCHPFPISFPLATSGRYRSLRVLSSLV